MNTIQVGNNAYQIKYGMSGIQEVLNLVKGKALKDLGKVEDLPLDKVPQFILAGIKNGAKVVDATIDEAAVLKELTTALDEDFTLYTKAMEFFGKDIAPDHEVKTEGN